MERHHTCINGHSLRAIDEGEEPTNTQEIYVIRLTIDNRGRRRRLALRILPP